VKNITAGRARSNLILFVIVARNVFRCEHSRLGANNQYLRKQNGVRLLNFCSIVYFVYQIPAFLLSINNYTPYIRNLKKKICVLIYGSIRVCKNEKEHFFMDPTGVVLVKFVRSNLCTI
jgi:hypothetical protein